MYVLTLKEDIGVPWGYSYELSSELMPSLLQFRLTPTPAKTFFPEVLLCSQASKFLCGVNSVLGGCGVVRMTQELQPCHGLKPLYFL